jgi:isocitrate dehydrogenase
MVDKIPITIARGDGIGPEIMQAVLDIFDKTNINIEINEIEIGQKKFEKGNFNGISPSDFEKINASKALLKAPIRTFQGEGFKSINLILRTYFGLYANIRPVRTYWPFIDTKNSLMDLVIVRENEEDLYCSIEYRQSLNLYHAKKIITKQACEKIIYYAFEYAKTHGRKKVSCLTKDNILKLTDGIFHKTFNEIAKQYPSIETDHFNVDIGSALIADKPYLMDVIVTPNLYGDIISDIAAQVAGSIGLGFSANIGKNFAMFEAIHGTFPSAEGKDIANPSGLILASIEMLHYLGLSKDAEVIHNALLLTYEDGIATEDIYNEKLSKKKVGTKAFAQAVIERIGKKPCQLKTSSYKKLAEKTFFSTFAPPLRKLIGFDIFVFHEEGIESLKNKCAPSTFYKLQSISVRGTQVWPLKYIQENAYCEYRLRFFLTEQNLDHKNIYNFLNQLDLEILSFETLYTFDGEKGYLD